uniref:ORF1+2p n=1 Tax=Gevuina avellana amalgavirus 1 TaxID=2058875 RepID=A0A2Z6JIR3_9VIRU|nr:TPA_exp: ORF1+2p [Gevuina avellana amalgavirus 1]
MSHSEEEVRVEFGPIDRTAAAAGPSAQLHGTTTEREAQEEVTRMVQPLRNQGLNTEVFTLASIYDVGLTGDGFCKLARGFLSITDEDIQESLLLAGQKKGKLGPLRRVSVREFVDFLKWLKDTGGQAEARAIHRQGKLKKKASEGQSAEDLTLLQVFNLMLQDMSQAIKKERSIRDEEIYALRSKMRRLERQRDAKILEIREEYSPASNFKEPESDEVGRLSYDIYVQRAKEAGHTWLPKNAAGLKAARDLYGQEVRNRQMMTCAAVPTARPLMFEYLRKKILQFDAAADTKQAETFVTTWQQLVAQALMRHPLVERQKLANLVPVGRPPLPGTLLGTWPLRRNLSPDILKEARQSGLKGRPELGRGFELQGGLGSEALLTGRIKVLVHFEPERVRSMAVARSKFEAGVRKIIGGGEMRGWRSASSMYRGGGNSNDALRLLSQAKDDFPGRFLTDVFKVDMAREALCLESDLAVPDGFGCCSTKNFNNEATAGPFLRAFGVKVKHGLKTYLEQFMWGLYDRYGDGEINQKGLPHLTTRIGFRTKLVTREEALRKVQQGTTFGRAVMMLDALEQVASSPLYNVLSHKTFLMRNEPGSGFRNATIRASSDWGKMWEEVRQAATIVELDWSKFDRERPREDLLFIIEVILSCFLPKNRREKRLLEAYGIMLRRALVERVIVMDEGGVFTIDGMVPSGSLWTGWIDTALNILYILAACREIGVPSTFCSAKCAGDDNLTLFALDPGDGALRRLRVVLNEWFRAGIDEEEFLVHRPPYHVKKVQACFPEGVDISKGTSKLLDKARWEEFEGELRVDVAAGRSHRWEYRFKGCPKFLSCYWLRDGKPIRPAADNLQKLLWPEGIHDSLDVYEAAIASMVVDNPWNHHNVNHLMSRYVIIQQVRRFSAGIVPHEMCVWLSKFRGNAGEPVPYPMIAPWRRMDTHQQLEAYPEAVVEMEVFRDFVQGVTALYVRQAEGGIDAWKFMDILRGEGTVGEGQFGNDLRGWLRWMYAHPMTRHIRKVRGFTEPGTPAIADPATMQRTTYAFRILHEKLKAEEFNASEDFAIWLSTVIRQQKSR